MLAFFLALLMSSLISNIQSATLAYSVRQVTSPYTSKTYILHNSRSSSSHHAATLICSSYPRARLASLSADSGDIGFLGQFIESLEEPYWIGDMEDSGISSCAALYAGGAIAIPKPTSPHSSPCDSLLNVLCELN